MSIVRFFSYSDEKTYWSLHVTEATTVANVCEELAQKLLPEDEIFLLYELRTPKKATKPTGI